MSNRNWVSLAVCLLLGSSSMKASAGLAVVWDGTLFTCDEPDAEQVSLVGSFNCWDPSRGRMFKGSSGKWETTVALKAGRYEYQFLIDGKTWMSDPDNPISAPGPYVGDTHSVVVVGEYGSLDFGDKAAGVVVEQASDTMLSCKTLPLVSDNQANARPGTSGTKRWVLLVADSALGSFRYECFDVLRVSPSYSAQAVTAKDLMDAGGGFPGVPVDTSRFAAAIRLDLLDVSMDTTVARVVHTTVCLGPFEQYEDDSKGRQWDALHPKNPATGRRDPPLFFGDSRPRPEIRSRPAEGARYEVKTTILGTATQRAACAVRAMDLRASRDIAESTLVAASDQYYYRSGYPVSCHVNDDHYRQDLREAYAGEYVRFGWYEGDWRADPSSAARQRAEARKPFDYNKYYRQQAVTRLCDNVYSYVIWNLVPDLVATTIERPGWLGGTLVRAFDHWVVKDVVPDGPLDAAGIEVGDAILSIDSDKVEQNVSCLAMQVAELRPGSEISLGVAKAFFYEGLLSEVCWARSRILRADGGKARMLFFPTVIGERPTEVVPKSADSGNTGLILRL